MYSSSCHHHLPSSLAQSKIQNRDILVPANPGVPGKMAVKTDRETGTQDSIIHAHLGHHVHQIWSHSFNRRRSRTTLSNLMALSQTACVRVDSFPAGGGSQSTRINCSK